jgi:hypothetical protein
MKYRVVLIAGIALSMSACLSFEVSDESNLSNAGSVITQNTAIIIDQAIKSSGHSDSQSMRAFKEPPECINTQKDTPCFEIQNERMKRLEVSNAGLISNAGQALKLKASLDVVNAYFFGLQDLVRDPTAARNAMAVDDLATQVNGLNRALGDNGSAPVISYEKKDALVKLVRTISDQIHARKVKQAVKRDAAVIDAALTLQTELLDWAEMNIYSDLTLTTHRFYREKVELPFAEQSSNMDERWVDNRLLYLKVKVFIESYQARKSARSQPMYQHDLWASALQGRYGQTVISRQINDINQIIALKSELEQAF